MNVYIDSCKCFLNGIQKGEFTFEEHLDRLKHSIIERLEKAEHVIICGMSPLGRKCVSHINELTRATISVWDIRENECTENDIPKITDAEQVVFIICSRESSMEYLRRISKQKAEIISYNELFLLSDIFGVENSQFHNRYYVEDRLHGIFDYPEQYIELLDNLNDTTSKEILCRTILYRLLLDLELAKDIQSTAKHYYFDETVIHLRDDEVFVDAGGYDGDTLEEFMDATNGKFQSYLFFEPDSDLVSIAKQKFETDCRISFIEKGLYRESGIVRFATSGQSAQGMISEQGEFEIPVIALDDMQDVRPTFIKMDIEGSECDALDGAQEMIKQYHPKLAICIYHRPQDILDVYQRMCNYGYRTFYMRAGKNSLDDDVILFGI